MLAHVLLAHAVVAADCAAYTPTLRPVVTVAPSGPTGRPAAGRVVLKVRVASDGSPTSIAVACTEVSRPHTDLARRTVKRWLFAPHETDGLVLIEFVVTGT